MTDKRDYTGLLGQYQGGSWLRDMRSRAQSRMLRNRPLSVPERFHWFRECGFNPWGLYIPTNEELAKYANVHVRELGEIESQDERWQAYQQFQIETEGWQLSGEPGAWSGQQALARSTARFRLAGQGRQSGKSTYGCYESIAVAKARPRSTIWVCAPFLRHVSRVFDMLWEVVHDLRWKLLVERNSAQEKKIMLENGSVFEGISMENYRGAAGATVNFLLLDEAAQISADAWVRALLPPLSTTLGQALLITSYEGQGGFFYDQMEEAKKHGLRDWEAFHGCTWDNFYMFEKGIESESIQQIKRSTPPMDFLEQYGAIPAGERNLVYPQFRPIVHVGTYPYDPDLPVRLAVDPSKGANAYAALAIQEDPLSGVAWAIDEVYAVGAMAEEVHRVVNRKVWRENLQEVLMDNADPNEILRWCEAKFRAYAIPDKPQVEDRYPIVKRMLRDPMLYWPIYEKKLAGVLGAKGISLAEFKSLPIEDQRPVYIDVEEMFTDMHLTPEDVVALQRCSRFFVNEETCPMLVTEFQKYAFVRHRADNLNTSERGRKYMDHLLDALGYYGWIYWREDYITSLATNIDTMGLGYDMPTLPEVPVVSTPPKDRKPEGQQDRMRRFVDMTRDVYAPVKIHSMLEERWD